MCIHRLTLGIIKLPYISILLLKSNITDNKYYIIIRSMIKYKNTIN